MAQTPTSKRILVVEDDDAVRKLITRALQSQFEVEAAENGAVALERLGRAPSFDLVICDVMMPQMTGVELLKRLRLMPSAKGLPVVFLTARDTPADVVEGINLGVRQYLTKPFKVDELLKKVQKLLRV
jgi:DNA-binding response OmpR family regulator